MSVMPHKILAQLLAQGAVLIALLAPTALPSAEEGPLPGREPDRTNPIIPGYYADPVVVAHAGTWYLYATLDPWGGATLGCWESTDFINWSYRALNWPTKAACTSPDSGGAMVWAPAVVQGPDGRFFMYVSVGSEIWLGVADHPAGPWKDLLGGRPLVGKHFNTGYHMIDADVFRDDDGRHYLLWGSGLSWDTMDSRCWIVELAPDMTTFVGQVQGVKLPHYLEGPVLVKRHGRYVLTYSWGNTTKDTYQVHAAVGDGPLGPFREAPAPLLATDHRQHIISPGHHTIVQLHGQDYLLYHRHSIPFDRLGRQLCLDPVQFAADGTVTMPAPSHDAPSVVHGRWESQRDLTRHAVVTASDHEGLATPAMAFDNNFATHWTAKNPDAWLKVDLGKVTDIGSHLLRTEYAWKSYAFRLESSLDDQQWTVVADFTTTLASGSPIVIAQSTQARYVRLVFPPQAGGAQPSLWEWTVRPPVAAK